MISVFVAALMCTVSAYSKIVVIWVWKWKRVQIRKQTEKEKCWDFFSIMTKAQENKIVHSSKQAVLAIHCVQGLWIWNLKLETTSYKLLTSKQNTHLIILPSHLSSPFDLLCCCLDYFCGNNFNQTVYFKLKKTNRFTSNCLKGTCLMNALLFCLLVLKLWWIFVLLIDIKQSLMPK